MKLAYTLIYIINLDIIKVYIERIILVKIIKFISILVRTYYDFLYIFYEH